MKEIRNDEKSINNEILKGIFSDQNPSFLEKKLIKPIKAKID